MDENKVDHVEELLRTSLGTLDGVTQDELDDAAALWRECVSTAKDKGKVLKKSAEKYAAGVEYLWHTRQKEKRRKQSEIAHVHGLAAPHVSMAYTELRDIVDPKASRKKKAARTASRKKALKRTPLGRCFDTRDMSWVPGSYPSLCQAVDALWRSAFWSNPELMSSIYVAQTYEDERHFMIMPTQIFDMQMISFYAYPSAEECMEAARAWCLFGAHPMYQSVNLTLVSADLLDPRTLEALSDTNTAPTHDAHYPHLNGFEGSKSHLIENLYRVVTALVETLEAHVGVPASSRANVMHCTILEHDVVGPISLNTMTEEGLVSRDSSPTSGAQDESDYYTFEVTLKHTRPRVWRRFKLPVHDTTFLDLHRAIQDSMNWYDGHLWEFSQGRMSIAARPRDEWYPGSFDDAPGADEVLLTTFFGTKSKPGQKACTYMYDFGDSWEHKVERKKIEKLSDDSPSRIFDKAVGAAPPEDCGGIPGFERLRAIAETGIDPWGEDVQEMEQWYDLESLRNFDPDEVKRRFDEGGALQSEIEHAERTHDLTTDGDFDRTIDIFVSMHDQGLHETFVEAFHHLKTYGLSEQWPAELLDTAFLLWQTCLNGIQELSTRKKPAVYAAAIVCIMAREFAEFAPPQEDIARAFGVSAHAMNQTHQSLHTFLTMKGLF